MNRLWLTLLFFPLFLISSISFAGQTSLVTYYPSPVGVYSKMQLVKGANGGGNCDAKDAGGQNFTNTGTLYMDANGYLKVCLAGKAVAYPGTCFNMFCSYTTGNPACVPPACPGTYVQAGNSETSDFQTSANTHVVSSTCCQP